MDRRDGPVPVPRQDQAPAVLRDLKAVDRHCGLRSVHPAQNHVPGSPAVKRTRRSFRQNFGKRVSRNGVSGVPPCNLSSWLCGTTRSFPIRVRVVGKRSPIKGSSARRVPVA